MKPPLRNRKDKKREKVIQIRVTEDELNAIHAVWGQKIPAIVRLYLLGHSIPEPRPLDGLTCQVVMHALHAYFAEAEPTRRWLRRNGDDQTKAQLVKEDEAFNHLARVCSTSF